MRTAFLNIPVEKAQNQDSGVNITVSSQLLVVHLVVSSTIRLIIYWSESQRQFMLLDSSLFKSYTVLLRVKPSRFHTTACSGLPLYYHNFFFCVWHDPRIIVKWHGLPMNQWLTEWLVFQMLETHHHLKLPVIPWHSYYWISIHKKQSLFEYRVPSLWLTISDKNTVQNFFLLESNLILKYYLFSKDYGRRL